MNRKISLFLVLFLMLALQSVMAQIPKALQDADHAGRAERFNVLALQNYHTPGTASAVCPTATSSTASNASTLSYLGSVTSLPIRLRIQNLGANKIYYNTYATNASGVIIPVATCSYLTFPGEPYIGTYVPALDNGEAADFIFYQTPTLSFGGAGSLSTFTTEVWTREGDPYQP